MEVSKQKLMNRNMLIEAAKLGDEAAIDTLSTDDLITYTTLNTRIQNEDLYSIVDTLFMPFGMETDMYSIIGNILDISQEENSITGESVLLLKIESSDIIFTVAIKKDDLQGEARIGRRFKGNVWLNGKINI